MKQEIYRNNALDGLKGISMLFIVIYHSGGAFDNAYSRIFSSIYCYGGYIGDYIFFILSGYLMALHYKERLLNGGLSLKNYVAKRLVRLYPLYFITNVIAFILSEPWKIGIDIYHLILTFLMINNAWVSDGNYPYNVPSWYVNALMLCYIIYFILCRIAKERTDFYKFFSICFIILGHALIKNHFNVPFLYNHDGEAYLNFFLGVMIFEILNATEDSQNRMLGAASLICILLILILATTFGLSAITSNIPVTISFICLLVMVTSILDPIAKRLLSCKLFVSLGKISMSTFLWHMPILISINLIKKQTKLSCLFGNMGFITYIFSVIVVAYISTKILNVIEPKIADYFIEKYQ